MRNIKVVLEYQGTRYFGFQYQPGRPTIQRSFEQALSKLFNRKMKIASASGRTDSGVHARHQVVNFKTTSRMPCEKILKGLNHYLPKEMSVREAKDVSAGFHARFSAKRKTYKYYVWNHSARSPLKAAFSYHFPHKLNVSRMRKAASILTGRHDFKSFCAADARYESLEGKGTKRCIKRLTVKRQGGLVIILVEADGFLYHMVRNLVGTLLSIGTGRMALEELKPLIKARDRRRAAATVPACGLVLSDVSY